MRWSRQERATIERGLDAAERSAITVLRVILGIALLGVLALVGIVVATRRPGGNTQGEYYYFAVAVLVVLFWIAGQFGRVRDRERHMADRQAPGAGPRWKPTFRVSRDAGALPIEEGEGFQRSFELRFGTGPEAGSGEPADRLPPGARTFTFGRSFEVPLASLPADVVPDEATLAAMALSLRLGEDLDHLCEAVQPAYRDWGMLERRAYRFLIESKLAERKGDADPEA